MALGLPDDPAQQKRLLIGIVPLVLLFFYWYMPHADYVAELDSKQTRLERLEARNSQARLRAPQSQQLEERLAQFERHIERLEELVPRGEEVSQLLNQISENGDRIGVTLVRFVPGSTDAGVHYNRRTFELTVRGGYHDIARFMSDIGSMSRIITPIDLSLVRQRGATREDPLEAFFVIETYVLPESSTRANTGASSGA